MNLSYASYNNVLLSTLVVFAIEGINIGNDVLKGMGMKVRSSYWD